MKDFRYGMDQWERTSIIRLHEMYSSKSQQAFYESLGEDKDKLQEIVNDIVERKFRIA